MTKRQEQLVRESFESIAPMAAPLAKLFYGRLFTVNPALRPMFKGDIKVQGKKLMDMLQSCIDSLGRFEELRPQLRELGFRHVQYGVTPDHYPQVAAALTWSLAQALETQFDRETREAWTVVITAIAEEMLAGATAAVKN